MGKRVSILLVGISGYGNVYLKELLNNNYENAYLKGVVDINPTRSDYYEEIMNRDIPIYESLDEYYRDKGGTDLAIIATPIHLHKEQACYAMNHGSNVLCEKPMTANPADIEELISTRDKTGKFIAIGFNWSFTPSIQQLKEDIISGLFGKPKRLKSIVLWPRNEDYYNRTSWAGKKYSPDGRMIFDSVVNNATAHFLHNLFYLIGSSIDTSAELENVTAELYCVNAIETFDTCAVKIKTKTDIDIFFYASHSIKDNGKPHFILEFEKATIFYEPGGETSDILAIFEDGTKKVYEDPEKCHLAKLKVCINAIQEGNHQILCGPEAASSHVNCINAMHQSVPHIPSFPTPITHYEKEQRLHWIQGLDDTLIECYQNWCLPSDLGIEWGKLGKTIRFS